MKGVIKTGFGFLLKQIIAIMICFFAISVFSAAILNETTKIILFALMLVIYFGLFYSNGWKMGKLDNKPYNDIKPSVLRPLKAWVVTLIVPVALIVLYTVNGQSPLYKLAANVWHLPLSLLYNDGAGTITPFNICYLSLVMPISLVIGYLVGTKGFSVQDKIETIRIKHIEKKRNMAQAERERILQQRKNNKK